MAKNAAAVQLGKRSAQVRLGGKTKKQKARRMRRLARARWAAEKEGKSSK